MLGRASFPFWLVALRKVRFDVCRVLPPQHSTAQRSMRPKSTHLPRKLASLSAYLPPSPTQSGQPTFHLCF